MPTKVCGRSENYDMSEIKRLIGAVKVTIENSAYNAYLLIAEGRYDEAKEYLSNAIEGIEILEG